jgi:mannose-6-phosphate isomerase-like protein (cupin superfamily)
MTVDGAPLTAAATSPACSARFTPAAYAEVMRGRTSLMPERPEPDIGHVRDAMREHDEAPRPSGERGGMEDGVSVVRLDLEGEDRFQPLRRELGVSTFGLNLIRLRPGQRGRIHRHERQEEVYVVLEGTLTLGIEGEERELPRGSAARVAPDVRRQLSNRGSEPLVLLAMGGAEQHQGRDGAAFTSWEDETGASPQEIPLPPDLKT